MKTFEVILTKSYVVRVQAKSARKAQECVEYFIGDSQSLANSKDEKEHQFKIEDIECTENEVVSVDEI